MGFLIKKFGPEPEKKPGKKGRPEPEPVIVHKPSCRSEAYLTVRGGLKWDREHLAEYEAELRKKG